MIKSKIKNISIYLDGASFNELESFDRKIVKGFTYNPSLFRSFDVKNYLLHCKKVSQMVYPLPVSLEVFADDEKNMIRQAEILSRINKNVVVKIPITFTNGIFTKNVIKILVRKKINLNITAIFNLRQVKKIFPIVKNTETILSIFAGRIHDMGIDAVVEVKKISTYIKKNNSRCKILWASTRQVYDILCANKSNCHIITLNSSILKKINNFNKNWKTYSLQTVKQFYQDAKKSKFII